MPSWSGIVGDDVARNGAFEIGWYEIDVTAGIDGIVAREFENGCCITRDVDVERNRTRAFPLAASTSKEPRAACTVRPLGK